VSQGYLAIAIFVAVYALIIVGRTRRYRIPIWFSMLIGAFLMIVFQVVGLGAALKSINLDVIGFLFGMFSIVAALDKSGVLRLVAVKILSKKLNNGFGGDAHINQWMMLASASTIAGNLTILGAASNVIIINAAESRVSTAFTFAEFFKFGVIVTFVNIIVYFLLVTFL